MVVLMAYAKKMNSKGEFVSRNRKDMLHEKLNRIMGETRNIIELIEDIQIRAAAIVSDLDLETDEHELLLQYPAACGKLEEWQTQISRIRFNLEVFLCKEYRREPEDSNATSTASQGMQKVEELPNVNDVTLWTIPCLIQKNDILDMRFISGNSPHDFWLRFYSTIELKEIGSDIQRLFETNTLQPLKSSELFGDVCICNGVEYIRGKVIKQCTDSPSYMVLNVDSGDILKVEIDKIYRLTEELAKFPVQAINCCLEGRLGDRVLWDARAVKLFHRVMEDSSLVVTICSVPTEICSKFVVKVDVHNELCLENKIDLSTWITNSVLPTLVQKRTKNGITKQNTSQKLATVSYPKFLQHNAEDAQKGRGHKAFSMEDKQNEAILINTSYETHEMETASITTQIPFSEVNAFGEDSNQETSSIKMNFKNTDRMRKVSLRYLNLKFEVGGRYQAFVVHINDPDDFYIHVACYDTAYIETLDKEMTKNYETCSFKFRNKGHAKIMLYESWCAVFYEDEHLWHRGKVINWKDDNDIALEVQYVDYGEVREVDLSMIKPLKEEYTKLPICATQCRLGNIHPPQLQRNSKKSIWPSETIELFKVLAVRDKLHSIVVTSASTDPISVLLVTKDKTVINKALLDLEYARAFTPIEFDPNLAIQLITENEENLGKNEKVNNSSVDKLSQNCHTENKLTNSDKTTGDCQKGDDKENVLERWDPMADDFFSVDNTQYRDDENACYAVSGYIPQDEQRICKFYAKSGRCFKGVTCAKEHSMPNPDGWTTDRETVLQKPFSYLVLPAVGTSVTVEVTVIYTLNMFYAHIFWEGRIKQEEKETLLTLNRSMNSRDNVSKMKRPRIIPAVGQLVLARFIKGGNGSFFRARVIDTNIEENKVQVVYVDYANTEWVSERNVREMEPRFLHLPFQAVECYISKVSPKADNKKALLELSDLILGRQLVGVLISKDILGRAEIELWDGDQKVSDKLIKKGYADYRESPLFLSEGASIIPG